MLEVSALDLVFLASLNAAVRVSWTGQSTEYWQGVLQGSQGGAAGVGAVLHRHGLPKRLADALCHEAGVTATPLAQLKKVTLHFSVPAHSITWHAQQHAEERSEFHMYPKPTFKEVWQQETWTQGSSC